jgi:regulatory protein
LRRWSKPLADDAAKAASSALVSPEPAFSELQDLSQSLSKKNRPALSLKMRAVGYLSRRDHSRVELQRKLAPYCESLAEIEPVLLDLERQGFFSESRFVASFTRRRAEKFGVARVSQELSQHRISSELTSSALAALKHTETQRAQSVWARRFDALPETVEERSKQHRFLLQRGFSGAAINAVLRGRVDLTSQLTSSSD